jgi:3-methyladenine DNA glycosylase/8-oxoguanine DNA glycosylase
MASTGARPSCRQCVRVRHDAIIAGDNARCGPIMRSAPNVHRAQSATIFEALTSAIIGQQSKLA